MVLFLKRYGFDIPISTTVTRVGRLFVNTLISAAALIRERRLLSYFRSSCGAYSRAALIRVAALMHGSILPVTIPPPPGNPRDKSSPLGPGVGNCLKQFCPGGRGAGQIENNFSFFSVKHVTSLLFLS